MRIVLHVGVFLCVCGQQGAVEVHSASSYSIILITSCQARVLVMKTKYRIRMNVEQEMTVVVSSQISRFEKLQCPTGMHIPLVGKSVSKQDTTF